MLELLKKSLTLCFMFFVASCFVFVCPASSCLGGSEAGDEDKILIEINKGINECKDKIEDAADKVSRTITKEYEKGKKTVKKARKKIKKLFTMPSPDPIGDPAPILDPPKKTPKGSNQITHAKTNNK